MRLSKLCPTMALVQFSIFALAIPLDSISTSRRSQCCSNYPVVVSDNLVDRSNPTSHLPRAELGNMVYRVQFSQVVLKITLSAWTPKLPVLVLLLDAYSHVKAIQGQQGMGLVPGGQFEKEGVKIALRMWNANTHQLTWRVVGLVIEGLLQYFNTLDIDMAPSMVMSIFDGPNQVAEGMVAITGHT